MSGDFGVADGPESYTVQKQDAQTVISYETEQFRVRSVFTEHPNRVVQFFTKITYTNMLTVYPVLDPEGLHRLGDQVMNGAARMDESIFQEKFFCNDCIILKFKRV